MMTIVYDLARVAGVPTATVPQIMHGSGAVSADTTRRVHLPCLAGRSDEGRPLPGG
jgi:plasmid maintenance system antidote protein VapI